jgi:phosphoglycolate phosphatase
MPAEALMVGDSHTDIDAALATGCPSVVVAHGYEQRPLDSLGADAVVSGLVDAGLEVARRMRNDRIGELTSKLRRPA